jgi:hypothetical protein
MTQELKEFKEPPINQNFMEERSEPRTSQSVPLYEIPKYIGQEAYTPEQQVE